jgi:hypothetical protein
MRPRRKCLGHRRVVVTSTGSHACAGGFGGPPPEHVTVQETGGTHGADMAFVCRLVTQETIPTAV